MYLCIPLLRSWVLKQDTYSPYHQISHKASQHLDDQSVIKYQPQSIKLSHPLPQVIVYRAKIYFNYHSRISSQSKSITTAYCIVLYLPIDNLNSYFFSSLFVSGTSNNSERPSIKTSNIISLTFLIPLLFYNSQRFFLLYGMSTFPLN